jgi:hypothetical protein
MTGRPSTYNAKIATAICMRLASGESLRAVCKDDDMPVASTVHLWVLKFPDFSEQYARARELQAETLVDEIIDISDDGSNDWMARNNADGQEIDRVVDHEHITRSRLRVDSRKWYASKVLPKKYGEKIQADFGGPLVLQIVKYADDTAS